jgi:hypothetical protein
MKMETPLRIKFGFFWNFILLFAFIMGMYMSHVTERETLVIVFFLITIIIIGNLIYQFLAYLDWKKR